MNRLKKDIQIGRGDISSSRKERFGECALHCHDFFEIEYFSEGSGEHYLDGEKTDIMPGMLYFMTPLNFHSFRSEKSVIYNTMFSEKLCDPISLSLLIEKGEGLSIMTKDADRTFLEAVFSELCNSQDDNYSMHLLNAALGKLITMTDITPTDISPVAKTLVYMTEHFREKMTLDDVAELAGFTPTYFSTLFKKEVGITFKGYLDRLRFGYAKKLVEHSNKSISEICYDSGFSDYPNFLRRFKERFGVTPGHIRCRA